MHLPLSQPVPHFMMFRLCPCKSSSEIRGLSFPGKARQTFIKSSGTRPEPVRVWAPTWAQMSLHNSPERKWDNQEQRGTPQSALSVSHQCSHHTARVLGGRDNQTKGSSWK